MLIFVKRIFKMIGGIIRGGHSKYLSELDDGFPLFAPVGSFPAGASPYGVLDMAGNVFEWVADWYDSVFYTKDPPRDNPTGPAENPYYPNHVLRGGSWLNELFMLRSAFRDGVDPFEASPVIGFRCVVSP